MEAVFHWKPWYGISSFSGTLKRYCLNFQNNYFKELMLVPAPIDFLPQSKFILKEAPPGVDVTM